MDIRFVFAVGHRGQGVDRRDSQVIALRPTWAGILDFQNRLPGVMNG